MEKLELEPKGTGKGILDSIANTNNSWPGLWNMETLQTNCALVLFFQDTYNQACNLVFL